MIDKLIRTKIDTYSDEAIMYAEKIVSLMYETAELAKFGDIEESLKWGEPSFNCQHGSPMRIGWKADIPNKFFIYYNCQSKLVETFKDIYGSQLSFEGNRAIILDLEESIPSDILKRCMSMALNYHRVKHLPMLGN